MRNMFKIILLILFIFLTGCEKKYTVTFVDESGQIIDSILVKKGESAISPQIGNSIIIWDQDINNVTSDLVVVGKIVPSDYKFQITYKDIEGKILKVEYVKPYEDASDYELPNMNGYKFIGWNKNLTNITDDIEVSPIFEKEVRLYKIEFVGFGGEIQGASSIQYVEENEMPIVPTFIKDMNEFIGYDKEIVAATNDCTYYAKYKELTIEKIPSIELVKQITFGWNYVNGMNEDNDDDKIIDLLLEKNINTVQLPIAWITKCDDNYVINEDYLNKVKLFVDKAVNKGLYVVISSYDTYENQWSSLNYDNFDRLIEVMNVQWTQIGEMFKEYDEHVIFSFLNEPRDYTDNQLDKEAYHILNDVNQMFVDLIRKQGNNNLYRHIIITTGWSGISDGPYEYFRMVDDDYVIVGLHSYTPFGFVHNATLEETSWTQSSRDYQIEILMEMQNTYDNFINKGIPVLMTEFGSRDKDNDLDRGEWLEYYVSCAYAYGIKCFIWDAAKLHFNREYTFANINRETYVWAFPLMTNKLDQMLVNNHYINFYLEARNQVQKISQPITIPSTVTNLLTNEVESCVASYDQSFFNIIDGKLYAKQSGKTVITLQVNEYIYYYQIEVYPDYQLINTNFTLKVDTNPNNDLQCFIDTVGYSIMRVDYDWYSSDSTIISIDQYSTITIKKDGVVGIIAISKENGDVGVVEVETRNFTIVSFKSIIQNID